MCLIHCFGVSSGVLLNRVLRANFRVNILINTRYKWLARDLIYLYIPKPLTFDNIHIIMSQSNFTSSTIYTNFVFRVSASAASNTGYDLALFYQVIM